MGAFSKEHGIYSPKIGLFTYAITLQMIIGYCMLLCSPNKLNISALVKVRNIEGIKNVGLDLLQTGGIVHVILAVLCFALLMLSHVVTRCFKLPMLIATALQTMYCSVTASICVLYLQRGYFNITKVIKLVKRTGFAQENPIFDDNLLENRNYLFIIGLLSVIAASLFHKAQVVKGNDSTPQVMVVTPSLSLGLAVSFCLTAPCRDYRTFTLGSFWFLVCSVGDVLSSMTRFCCFKPLKLIMFLIYTAICGLSVITLAVCTKLYTMGNIDYSAYLDIIHGKVMEFGKTSGHMEKYDMVQNYFKKLTTEYTDEQLNVYMGNGNFLIVAVMLCIVTFIFSLISLIYSFLVMWDIGNKSEDNEIKVVVS